MVMVLSCYAFGFVVFELLCKLKGKQHKKAGYKRVIHLYPANKNKALGLIWCVIIKEAVCLLLFSCPVLRSSKKRNTKISSYF